VHAESRGQQEWFRGVGGSRVGSLCSWVRCVCVSCSLRFVSMIFPARWFCLLHSFRMCSMLFRVKSAVVIPGGAL
jgi:hypothetical protein